MMEGVHAFLVLSTEDRAAWEDGSGEQNCNPRGVWDKNGKSKGAHQCITVLGLYTNNSL